MSGDMRGGGAGLVSGDMRSGYQSRNPASDRKFYQGDTHPACFIAGAIGIYSFPGFASQPPIRQSSPRT
jgi:hypothetical protein